ncbi:afg1 family protein, partial [Cystoisospora suis]
MILKRLFEALFSYGAIVVATSNRPPSELYAGGLNRDRFLPFIDLLLDCCEVFHIETRKDYRLSKLTASSHGLYFVPPREEEEILKQFKYLLQDNSLSPGPGSIQVSMGRDLQVPWMSGGFAQFSFEDLCMRSVGPSDFLAIAQHFHTVFLSTIPDLHDKMDDYPNEIRRFISLIDILYEKHTRVIFDAAAPPFRLLGIPPSVEHFELLRQSIQNQFHTLQDFLNALKPFCLEKAASSSSSFPSDMINEENWRKGTRQLLNLPN